MVMCCAVQGCRVLASRKHYLQDSLCSLSSGIWKNELSRRCNPVSPKTEAFSLAWSTAVSLSSLTDQSVPCKARDIRYLLPGRTGTKAGFALFYGQASGAGATS